MTVSTEIDHNDYTGNGVTTVFPYNFRIFRKEDLTVTVIDNSGVSTTLVLDTDYTVSGAGGYNGGSITKSSPLPDGWKISVARILPLTQETDLRNQGTFFPEVHEDAFDKLTMLLQQIRTSFSLALRKPSTVADWYDALNNYIRNLKDPRDPQDAATKNYVDSSVGKTLRVPEDIPELSDAASRANKILATDNMGNFMFVPPQSGSAADVLVELAKPTGPNLIGSPVGTTLMNYLATSTLVDPRMPPFNYKSTDSIATRTASLQAAFDYCNANKTGLMLAQFYDVNSITLIGHTDYSIFGSGGIIARGTGTAAVEMKNCRNINWMKGVSINNAGSFSYGLKVWGDSTTGTSLMSIGLVMVGFPVAFRFGDVTYPDALCSEITVHHGYTYNCRRVYEAYGSQTVINFDHYQLLGQAPTSVGSNTMGIGDQWGAVVHINGGECISATDSLNQGFRSFPINSPGYEHAYGSVYITGAAVECAGLWYLAYNPDAVSAPSAGSGAFVMVGCHGFAGFSGLNIQVADAFTGKINIDKSCKFHRTTAKGTSLVVASGGAYPTCDISDQAFDANFPKGFQKFNGTCVPMFEYRCLGVASNLNNQQFVAGNQADMHFISVDTSGLADNGVMLEFYNKTTGVFTVPKGGLKDVRVQVQVYSGLVHSGSTIMAMSGGAPFAYLDASAIWITGTMHLGNLVEGFQFTLRLQNGGATWTSLASNNDYFALYARR